MSTITRGWTRAILTAVALALAGGNAAGQHLGWCIGVGNKHNSGCAPAGSIPTGGSTTTPPVASLTEPPTGPTLPGTPPTIVVPQAVPTPVPQAVPTPVPQAVPTPVPQAVPTPVPHPVPQAVPQQVPHQVPPMPPQAVPVPATVPQAVPTPVPHPVPQAVPHQVPHQVPPMLPQAVPALVGSPGASGGATYPFLLQPGGTTTPVVIARPIPSGASGVRGVDPQSQGISLVETATRQPWTVGLVTERPGRQQHHATPSYRTDDGHLIHCLAGGFGWRYVVKSDGSVRLAGRLPVLRTTDVIVRDLPANHLVTPDCIVAVRRRFAD